jgi:ABC-type nitrate/sulfonate/bicarbonate transport system permease component
MPAATTVVSIASVGVILLVWELAPRLEWISEGLVPPMSEVFAEVWDLLTSGALWDSFSASAPRWIIGFGVALVGGTFVGLLMGRNKLAFALINPIVILTYPVPKAALILILVAWLGFNLTTMAVVIALGAAIPIVLAAYAGAKAINTRLLWAARSLGAGRVDLARRFILPAALPEILSGIRIAIPVSLFALIGSELLIRQEGLGASLFNRWDTGNVVGVWGYTAVVAMLGFALDALYSAMVRWLAPWVEI